MGDRQIDRQRLIELYNQNPRLIYKEIAKILGVSVSKVVDELSTLQHEGIIAPRNKRGKPLTLTQTQLNRLAKIKMYVGLGLSLEQIGKKLGTSRQAIHQFISKHAPGLFKEDAVRQRKIRLLRIVHKDLIERYNQSPNLTTTEIAKQLGDNFPKVWNDIRLLQKYGLLPKQPRKNARRLTDKQIAKLQLIHQLRTDGLSWPEIGKKLGKTYPHLWKFYNTYKHHLKP